MRCSMKMTLFHTKGGVREEPVVKQFYYHNLLLSHCMAKTSSKSLAVSHSFKGGLKKNILLNGEHWRRLQSSSGMKQGDDNVEFKTLKEKISLLVTYLSYGGIHASRQNKYLGTQVFHIFCHMYLDFYSYNQFNSVYILLLQSLFFARDHRINNSLHRE